MYTTIEADIKNGRITGPESQKLPAMAHVLITLIPPSGKEKGVQEQRGSENSLFGSLNRFARPDRIQEESGAWYEAAGRKHDPS
jgi:hypothetical protein